MDLVKLKAIEFCDVSGNLNQSAGMDNVNKLLSTHGIEAPRKKGLTAEEKRSRMLELFHESNEFFQRQDVNEAVAKLRNFQMKDLERIAPKQKGIIPQSVKEITQLLVDEGLVECEKIGTFVCYWAFPSQSMITVTEEQKKLKLEINDLQMKHETLTKKLKKLSEEDPESITQLENEINKARNDANRWTDITLVSLLSRYRMTAESKNEDDSKRNDFSTSGIIMQRACLTRKILTSDDSITGPLYMHSFNTDLL
ncbi:Mnd1 family protein [Dirofilaria immitis]|nr:Mnd1 family protein [Dirofilaria immitis]